MRSEYKKGRRILTMMANLARNHLFTSGIAIVGLFPKMIYAAAASAGGGSHVYCTKITSGNTRLDSPGQSSTRRSSDGHRRPPNPNCYFNHFDQSVGHEYEAEAEEQMKRIEVLKGLVRTMLKQEVKQVVDQLELIDTLQRLGLSYHFQQEIHSILCIICSRHCTNDIPNLRQQQDLYSRALEFRLLRQHGFYVSPDIFDILKDENGAFKTSLWEDPKGMLSLYEASYLGTNADGTKLRLAREFAHKYLEKKLDENEFDEGFSALVRHSLEIPLHWRMKRLEVRWFVEVYEETPDMNPILLEFAKIDFNVVQRSYQNELKSVSRWWKSIGGGEEFKFARDMLVDNFVYIVGVISGPEYGYCRIMGTKVAVFITIIDDMYDSYASLDELELFTRAIQRWDVNSIDELPRYMQLSFIALHSFTNQVAYDALKRQGVNVIPYITKAWTDLCRAYLHEAKWCFNGYTPTLEEYLNNALISIGTPLFLLHSYIFLSDSIKKEDLEYIYQHKNTITRSSAIITRLTNDLGPSLPIGEELEGGDIAKAIKCHKKESGATEDKSREYIQVLIMDAWEEMNMAQVADYHLLPNIRELAMDIGRTAHTMYHQGDGHQNSEMPNHIANLFFKPI